MEQSENKENVFLHKGKIADDVTSDNTNKVSKQQWVQWYKRGILA